MPESTALMNTWKRYRKICARCRIPLEEVATHGGWDSHLCHDLLRSKAFERFWERVRDPFHVLGVPIDEESAAFHLRWSYLRLPPWERPIALKILEHAKVEFDA